MFKTVAFLAVIAVASAQSCGYYGGYLSNINGLAQSRVLNVGCTVPVASACPPCAPVATPTQIVEGTTTPVVATAFAPVVSTGIVSSGLYGTGCYGDYGYESTLGCYGSGSGVLATIC